MHVIITPTGAFSLPRGLSGGSHRWRMAWKGGGGTTTLQVRIAYNTGIRATAAGSRGRPSRANYSTGIRGRGGRQFRSVAWQGE